MSVILAVYLFFLLFLNIYLTYWLYNKCILSGLKWWIFKIKANFKVKVKAQVKVNKDAVTVKFKVNGKNILNIRINTIITSHININIYINIYINIRTFVNKNKNFALNYRDYPPRCQIISINILVRICITFNPSSTITKITLFPQINLTLFAVNNSDSKFHKAIKIIIITNSSKIQNLVLALVRIILLRKLYLVHAKKWTNVKVSTNFNTIYKNR